MKTRTHYALLVAIALAAGPIAAADLEVEIEGVSGNERANIEARLGSYGYAESGGSDAAQFRRLHRKAPEEIRSALQAFGYYSPRVRSRLHSEGKRLKARYEIQLGPPTLIDSVTIELNGEGAEFPELYKQVAQHPLRKGRRVSHADYGNFKSDLLRRAFQHGFLDATYTTHELRVDIVARRADIALQLDTGPRYYYGSVRLEQDDMDEQFLRRYVPLRTGDPFAPQELLDTQFALADLGYFARVEVQPMREEMEEGNHIPVRIVLSTRPPTRYEIGVGYGTDRGARATLGTEFRRLTRSGHNLRSEIYYSLDKKSIGGEYRIPLGNKAGDNLGFTGGYTDEKYDDIDTFRYDIGTYLARTPGEWQRRLYLNYKLERSYESTGTDTATLLTPGLSLSRGETDDPIHARLGWFFFFDVHGAHDAALSDNTFLQLRGVIRAVVPLGERARLLGRIEQGASFVEEFSSLPPSERFFAGGDQSVRGYAYRSLGPRDENGEVVGGEFLSSYSLEAEMRVWGNWGAAIFADAGNADDEPAPPLLVGVGTGVRYRAPVGTFQIDFAHPLEGERRGIRLHLGIRVGL